jgi:hypothetical protein
VVSPLVMAGRLSSVLFLEIEIIYTEKIMPSWACVVWHGYIVEWLLYISSFRSNVQRLNMCWLSSIELQIIMFVASYRSTLALDFYRSFLLYDMHYMHFLVHFIL